MACRGEVVTADILAFFLMLEKRICQPIIIKYDVSSSIFSCMIFILLRYFPSILSLLSIFYHTRVLCQISFIHQELITCFLSFILLIWQSLLTNFLMLNHLFIPRINLNWLLCIILLMCFWIWFTTVCWWFFSLVFCSFRPVVSLSGFCVEIMLAS